MSHSPSDYATALRALMPPGEGFASDEESTTGRLVLAIADELARVEALADLVEAELDPAATSLFVESFESMLDLPDCGELPDTTAGRRGLILSKLYRPRNLHPDTVVAACAAVGAPVTIDESSSPNDFEVDVTIDGASLTVAYFRTGASTAGDSLGSFGDSLVECVLDHVTPAHINYRLFGGS